MTNLAPGHRLPVLGTTVALAGYLLLQPSLFRRKRDKPTRETAFAEIFDLSAHIFAAAGDVRPEWADRWQTRMDVAPIPLQELLSGRASSAVSDLRFARTLLQRNRWKSMVEPMFAESDEPQWTTFARAVAPTGERLLILREEHGSRLREDERDWLDASVEQFGDAWSHVVRAEQIGVPLPQRIAEGIYLHVYHGVQLSERFIERARQDAVERTT